MHDVPHTAWLRAAAPAIRQNSAATCTWNLRPGVACLLAPSQVACAQSLPCAALQTHRSKSDMEIGDQTILEEEVDENYEPTEQEILEYAQWLGMDVEKEKARRREQGWHGMVAGHHACCSYTSQNAHELTSCRSCAPLPL